MSSLVALIHGDSGVGKSRLGVTSPSPRLIIDAEGGSRFAVLQAGGTSTTWDGHEPPPTGYDTVTVTLKDFSTLESITAWLASGEHPFVSVVFDSITEIQKRCLDLISPGVDSIDQRKWGELLRRMEQLVRRYRDIVLEDQPLRVVVFLAISAEFEGKFRALVQGQLRRTFPQYVDVVGHLRVEQDFEGNTTRTLRTQPDYNVEAKDRTDTFDTTIASPNISTMFDHLKENLG